MSLPFLVEVWRRFGKVFKTTPLTGGRLPYLMPGDRRPCESAASQIEKYNKYNIVIDTKICM